MSKSVNPRDLPTDRLSTTDNTGKRLWIYPADVRGRFKKFKHLVYSILIVLFLVAPWIKIHSHPLILLDLVHRRFSFFGIQFWATEAPLLVFLLLGFTLTIGFITSIWGRIWCGWACPQTVFIDGVFRKIERLIEGDALARKKLDEQPADFDKVFKKSAKWFLFICISLIISHSFITYFVGPEELFHMIRQSPSENPQSFTVMSFIVGLILFDFGWFREQFCTIMCPYGRFQSVLMDDDSSAVLYDSKRGEPRAETGDCVNCFRCVQVCPTGIDIRRGVQLECVACTSCIDACDEVMNRTHKPTGLIRYSSRNAMENGIFKTFKQKLFRPRSLIYLSIFIICMTGLTFILKHRKPLDFDIIRSKEIPYQVSTNSINNSIVTNHFKIDLRNRSFENATIELKPAANSITKNVEIVSQLKTYEISAGADKRIDFFVTFPKENIQFGHGKIDLEIHTHFSAETGDQIYTNEVRLVGPSI